MTAEVARSQDVVLAIVPSVAAAGSVATRLVAAARHPRTARPVPARPSPRSLGDGWAIGRWTTIGPGCSTSCGSGGRTVVMADGAAGLLYGLHDLVRRGEAAFAAPGRRDVVGRPGQRHPHARPLGQRRRPPGHGPGRARVRGRLDLLRRRAGPRRPVPRRAVRAAARVGRDQRGRAEQRQRARRRGAAAHRPPRRRRAARRRVPAVRHPRVPVGELRGARSRSAAWRRPTRSTPTCSGGGRGGGRASTRPIPDFGGFVVKADSEGQPGPFAYGRDHADGANLLARALAPYGGTVHWRAFVYDHHQDWRDRSTDRARAAYDHFTPLDGRFDDNVVLQVKYGPMDFQAREPVSPVIAAMPQTRLAVELQVTQEYTGQQQHAVLPRAAVDARSCGSRWPRTGARSGGLAAGLSEDHGRTGGPPGSSPSPTSATTSSGPATRSRRPTSTRSGGSPGTRRTRSRSSTSGSG